MRLLRIVDPRYLACMPNEVAIQPVDPADSAMTVTGQLALSELRRGDVLAGRFRIEGILGVGGMGVVYRAFDQSLDVDVAIKLLRPELARKPEAFERFRQELLLARQVSSPHVVRIHDIAQDRGRWFISMDFIDGESLERRLDDVGKLPTEQTLAIVRGLLEGLVAAHQRGVVHRDLKPANILIDKAECAYITDFGVARSLGGTGMTQSGMIVGTPEYLSPEQARGEVVDARSDLYAVGLMLYEMLSGTLPFAGGTPAETVMQRIVRQPPSLAKTRPDLPRWLQTFCDRLLKLSPAHRFASAQAALRALDTRRVPRPPLNRRILLLGVLALAMAAGAADWLRLHPPHTRASGPVAAALVTPSIALLPLTASSGDAGLTAQARGLEAHLHTWLRGDSALAVIPRRRVLQTVARTAPDAHGADLLRLLPVIANAAHANRMLWGELQHEGSGLTLHLNLSDANATTAPKTVDIRGADDTALFAAYLAKLPAFLALEGIHVDAPPVLATGIMPVYGQALVDLDRQQPQAAAKELAQVPSQHPPSALIASALLQAEESAQQPLPAQNTREAIIAQFAQSTAPDARALYADALSGNGQDDLAARASAQAVQAYPHDADLIMADADTLRAQGQGTQAETLLKNYLHDADDDARAWFLLGRTAIEHGDARVAVEDYLLHAQTLNILARDRVAEAETRNAIGIGYERLGQLDAAAEQYQRAVAIREQLDDRASLAKSLRNLAIVQAELGHRDEAEANLVRVKGLLNALGDRASMADLDNDRGVVSEEAGDFATALDFYRQAYALRQQLDDPAAVAQSLNNIGFCSYRMGDFDNAAVYWKQALAQYRTLDDRAGALDIQQSMALLDIAHGQFASARKQLEDSLRYAQAHQLPEEAAVAETSLTELALLEGRYADAETAIDDATQIFTRRADQRGQAETAVLRARIALALGDAPAADKALAAIDPKRLNREQTAEFLLATAQRVGLANELAKELIQLNAAADAATQAHSGALTIRVDLERVRAALASGETAHAVKLLSEVSKQTTRLSEVPLRLMWLELETAAALRSGNDTVAATHYRSALPLLKNVGYYSGASLLHGLGALALAGNAVEATAARTASQSARAQLLADAPRDSRATLEKELARRWRDTTGQEHEP